jgi:hypothetical protein
VIRGGVSVDSRVARAAADVITSSLCKPCSER